ncbi:hypothetical protein BG011_000329 [Mortierella polycephala]|uniref:Ion transport domain-containing protein n=1 Tax=Mortierella polycephala TaxID=41804 RepID=A0A9P6TVD8_9FUNG|nr:hypothetical protein BG011_000329 [Mortierella polycephala]
MSIYFFFTVIVMLNVLIALINVAFAKGDDGWRLSWIESRLRYIESAENMSYHIPGFRQTYNWFPEEIYFTASPHQLQAYREKHQVIHNKNVVDASSLEDWERDEFEDEKAESIKGKDENGSTGDAPSVDKNEEKDETSAPVSDTDAEENGKENEVAGEEDAVYSKTPEESEVANVETSTAQDVKDVKDVNDKDLDLRAQVAQLQVQLREQQEESQRQHQEMKALLLRLASSMNISE